MNEEDRGSWYLLTGLILGIAIGLVYAWVIQPMGYAEAEPASLHADYKDQYRTLIAAAYAANGDLTRARARLELLGDEDPYRALSEQAQRDLAGGGPEQSHALGSLAAALRGESAAPVSLPGGTPAPTGTSGLRVIVTQGGLTAIPFTPSYTPSVTVTPVIRSSETITGTAAVTPTVALTAPAQDAPTAPTATVRPRPTATPVPSPTPGGPFVLEEQRQVCQPDLGAALLQIEVRDFLNRPVPGLEVVVTWQEGEEHFFTGLKPELGPGYADFTLETGVAYTVRLEQAGQPVTGLSAPECEDGGETYPGGWYLLFSQP